LRQDLLGGVDRDREATPSVGPVFVAIWALTPMTRPLASSSGPPELPGLIAASVWRRCPIGKLFGAVIERPSAETTPS